MKTYTYHRTSTQTMPKYDSEDSENGFKFSKTKTHCIHFCQLHGLRNDPVLSLDGVEIPVVDQYKLVCHI